MSKQSHKAILFIGSESYDAPVITVLQGLHRLGYTIYTIKKANVNSWFCNKIVDDPRQVKFDFILSNLHWGTRWSYYKKYKLHNHLKVLIDGDDNAKLGTWRQKVAHYNHKYVFNPPAKIKNKELSPFRWMEPLGTYSPDIVFTSQRSKKDTTSHYLPFGIHSEYDEFNENLGGEKRTTSVAHIPGPGTKRIITRMFISLIKPFLKGTIINDYVRGKKWTPKPVQRLVDQDKNIHSYHRWTLGVDYFAALNKTKVLVYPGVDRHPFYDSKRPWEAYASGACVLFAKPNIDDSEYPFTKIHPYLVYNNLFDLCVKLFKLTYDTSFCEKIRSEAVKNAKKRFTPLPVAKHFLSIIESHQHK